MNRLERLKRAIRDEVFVRARGGQPIIATSRQGVYSDWIFDFRTLLLTPRWLDEYAELFWERYADRYPFQVGGMETVGIALVAAIVMKSVERGTPVNGFFLRKSRKRYGLMKFLEGRLTNDPVILVDDLINSGHTIEKELLVLKEAGHAVSEIFALVAFRPPEAYAALAEDGTQLSYPFTLEDFGEPFIGDKPPPSLGRFAVLWRFASGHPSFDLVVPKSAPALDDTRVYVGSDDGVFWAIEQETGEILWTHRIGSFPTGKGILSSPAIHAGRVYFGAYDGVIYALDSATGHEVWRYSDADWVGSSPAIAPDLDLLFVGLEFGLFKKRGGIVALSLKTGKRLWQDFTPALTHGSPTYIKDTGLVVIGSNDGIAYAYEAKSGLRRWQYQTRGEIKFQFAYDASRNCVLFGSTDGSLYALSAHDGSLRWAFKTGGSIFSAPVIVGDTVYVSSLDKYLYAVDLDTGRKRWDFHTSGRIFASPAFFEDSVWIGSNSGRLAELNPETGELRSVFQTTERIVNKIAYNKKTKRFFVPTVANELYCIRRSEESQP